MTNKRSTVACSIEDVTLDGEDYPINSVLACCARCGNKTESFGTSDRSIGRCLVLMRETCPRGEANHYTPERSVPMSASKGRASFECTVVEYADQGRWIHDSTVDRPLDVSHAVRAAIEEIADGEEIKLTITVERVERRPFGDTKFVCENGQWIRR